MRSKETDIIIALLENKEKELSINQLAKILRKDYKNTYSTVQRLKKLSVLSLERFGSSCRVCLKSSPHPLIYEAEYLRRQRMLKDKDIAVTLDTARSLPVSLFVLLLFGSRAKGTATRHSDIDLMFILPDNQEEMEREIHRALETIPLDIHINVFSESDFIAMKDRQTVGREAMMKNVILHGIEAYYAMIGRDSP